MTASDHYLYCMTNISADHLADFSLADERTLGSNRASSSAYNAAGAVKKDAMHFNNCINEPLIVGEDSETVLSICAPPELHLMQGIVKHLFDNMSKENAILAQLWLQKIHVKATNYHGGSFVGNDCLKMLRNADILQKLAEEHESPSMMKYVQIIRSFYCVVKSCFGMVLDSNYGNSINDFKDFYRDLGISVTPKVHILVMHVPEFISKHDRPLGWYS